MRRKSLAVVVPFLLVLAACGGTDGVVEVGDDEALLQITSEGGFAPVELSLSSGPRYTLLGDGRLIFSGVQTMEFPGPLLPPYMVARLDGNQMGAVLAKVEDIGLPDITDELDNSAANFVADAGTEVITFWDEGGQHRYAVYALGIEESPSGRNAAFLELIETFDRFTAEATAEPYDAVRVRIVAGVGLVDPDFADVREWPLGTTDLSEWSELANGWRCTLQEASILDVFADATQTTTWKHPDGVSEPLSLLVRPLHPGEPECP